MLKLLIVLAASAVIAAGQNTAATLTAEIPKLMEKGDVPGLSIAVVRDGAIAWKGAFGRRGPDPGSAPVNDDTVFAAASLSKPVFAYCVLRLVDRGEFDLDKPLHSYLPYPRLQHDERSQRITARMVLSHTTGLPNWGGTPLNLINPPGERFGYSGEGFVYLQKVIEKLTGKSLNDLVQQEAFAPLQMTRSSYVIKPELADNIVTGRDWNGNPQKLEPRDFNAAASLLTTASDFARFVIAVMDGKGLKPASAKAMLQPQSQARAQGLVESNGKIFWGLGWGLEKTAEGNNNFWHWGDNGGFKAFSAGNPAKREAFVYFSNSNDGLSIAGALTNLVLGGDHPAIAWLNYEAYDAPKRALRKELTAVFRRDGAELGLERYRELSRQYPQIVNTEFASDIGFNLLYSNKPAEAAALLKLDAEQADRRAANVHEGLAQAYTRLGQFQQAAAELEKSLAAGGGDRAKKRLVWVQEAIAAAGKSTSIDPAVISRYAGNYRERKLIVKDGNLFVLADGTPEQRLVPMSADTFYLENDPTARIKFVPGDKTPDKLIGLWMSGGEREFPRLP